MCFAFTFHILSASLWYLYGTSDKLLSQIYCFVGSRMDLGLGRLHRAMHSIQLCLMCQVFQSYLDVI